MTADLDRTRGYDPKRLYTLFFAISVLIIGTWTNVAPPSDLGEQLRIIVASFTPSFLIISFVRRRMWSTRVVRFLLGTRIPDIRGRWVGYILSSYHEFARPHEIAIEIRQTLDDVGIQYYDANATHESVAVGIEYGRGGRVVLHEQYMNIPHRVGLQSHYGGMRLIVDVQGSRMHGRYFNDPAERMTYGEIYLVKVDSKLLAKAPTPAESGDILGRFQIDLVRSPSPITSIPAEIEERSAAGSLHSDDEKTPTASAPAECESDGGAEAVSDDPLFLAADVTEEKPDHHGR